MGGGLKKVEKAQIHRYAYCPIKEYNLDSITYMQTHFHRIPADVLSWSTKHKFNIANKIEAVYKKTSIYSKATEYLL